MNIVKNIDNCISWIRNWYQNDSGNAKGIVIGMSGGKDSTVVAELCVKAIGKDHVYGVILPNGEQKDIDDAKSVCELLGIKYRIINIDKAYNSILNVIKYDGGRVYDLSRESQINIPPRIRMTILYAIAQSMKYRVAGTGNLSEHYIGYFTKWGDGACDFNPIAQFTASEVINIGLSLSKEFNIPLQLINKPPSDGLCGFTDEERFGFSYKDLDLYIDTGECDDFRAMGKICKMYERNLHKLLDIPAYEVVD